ncbi:hypothetical protein LLQ46_00365 [Rouxiella badensis]|uniref:hypothetical protein n=1 Tax=Rouxiella badensis TaxID=1646377 RepID=UPI001D15B387|nr:hypothetical protein [Rouxiella badensis]MCC3745301.1 hypothetical protein [Rouxiella badensis]
MSEMQQLWLQQYKNYLIACSPTGELSTFDYTAALQHADAVINSLLMLKEENHAPHFTFPS